MGSLFEDAGYSVPKAATAAPQPDTGALFKDAGFSLPGTAPTDPAAPAGAGGYVIVPGSTQKVWVDKDGQFLASTTPKEPEKTTLQKFHDAIDPATAIAAGTRESWDEMKRTAAASADMARSAWQDKTASGPMRAARIGLGTLGVLTSPIAGLTKGFVEDPVTALTGNPDAGRRAGFLTGFMVPVKGGGKIADATSSTTRATNALVNAVGPENVPATVARLRANPNLTLMDVSDPVRTMAQGLIDPSQPKAQTLLSDVAKGRISAAPGAVNDAYTAAMGPAPDTVKIVNAIQKHAEDVGSKIIQPALATAKPVDTTAVIRAIDSELKPGVQAVVNPGLQTTPTALQQELAAFRNKLVDANGSTIVDPMRLHEVQSQLRERAYQLSTSASGSERLLGRDLYDFRNKLVGAIDDATGGAYKPGLQKYRDAKQIGEAFEAGFDTLKNRSGVSGLEDRPEAFREWIKGATPEEIAARQFGTRADIDQKINGMRFAARQGTNIPEVEYNRQKLSMLFGKSEADRLVKAMEDQRDMALTNAKLLAGSKTAETLAGQKALEIRKVGGGNPLQYVAPVAAELIGQGAGLPGVGAGTAIALGGLHRGAQYVNSLRDAARNFEFARAASSVGPTREAAIEGLLAHPKVLSAQKKASNALTAP